MAVLRYRTIYLSFTTFFEFLTKFSQWFCYDSLLLHFPLQCWLLPPFIVSFQGFGVPLIFPLCSPKYQSLCRASHFGGRSLPYFLIVFFFWYLFLKRFLLTFLSGVSLESWFLISLPSRLLHLIFSDLAFSVTFPFVIFPEWADSIPAKLKVFPTTSLCGSSF